MESRNILFRLFAVRLRRVILDYTQSNGVYATMLAATETCVWARATAFLKNYGAMKLLFTLQKACRHLTAINYPGRNYFFRPARQAGSN